MAKKATPPAPTVVPASQHSLSKRSDVNLKLGLGLGISLVVVLLLFVAFVFLVLGFYLGYRRRKNKNRLDYPYMNGMIPGGGNIGNGFPPIIPPVVPTDHDGRRVRFTYPSALSSPTDSTLPDIPIVPPIVPPPIVPSSRSPSLSPRRTSSPLATSHNPNASRPFTSTPAPPSPPHLPDIINPSNSTGFSQQPESDLDLVPSWYQPPPTQSLPMTPSAYVQLPPQSPFPPSTSWQPWPSGPPTPWMPPQYLPPSTPHLGNIPPPGLSPFSSLGRLNGFPTTPMTRTHSVITDAGTESHRNSQILPREPDAVANTLIQGATQEAAIHSHNTANRASSEHSPVWWSTDTQGSRFIETGVGTTLEGETPVAKADSNTSAQVTPPPAPSAEATSSTDAPPVSASGTEEVGDSLGTSIVDGTTAVSSSNADITPPEDSHDQ